jgi:glycosyltransferase involved in cell wall biosynthesis
MKVLLAGSLSGVGGIQSHLKWMTRALREEGIETLLLHLGVHECSNRDRRSVESITQGSGLYCPPSKPDRGKLFGKAHKLSKFANVKAAVKEFSPDVYYAVGTGWNLFLAPLFHTTKSRLIFHEVMSGVAGDWRDPRWLVRWQFDEVIGQSPTVADNFARTFGWKKPVAAIPAMPEPLELVASLPVLMPKRVEVGKARAAFFSRLEPHKQAFWLVQQWDKLKDCLGELHIYGTGSEEGLIRNYISTEGLGERIKCFGKYPDGQGYVDLLSGYDLTLLPTVGPEGAPLVLLESMACGVPFVAYGVGGIPDYSNPDCFVVLTDPEKFVAGVDLLARRLAAGSIDSARLRTFYLDHYSYAVLKREWLAYLSSSPGA